MSSKEPFSPSVELPSRGLTRVSANPNEYTFTPDVPVLDKSQQQLVFGLHMQDTASMLELIGWTPEFMCTLETYVLGPKEERHAEKKVKYAFHGDAIVDDAEFHLEQVLDAQGKLYTQVDPKQFSLSTTLRKEYVSSNLGAMTHSTIFPMVPDLLTSYMDSKDKHSSFFLDEIRRVYAEYMDRRNLFIEANAKYSLRIARKFTHHSLTLSDLTQEAHLGLMKAHDRFEARRGLMFTTYARWWMENEVRNSLLSKGKSIRVPGNIHNICRKARQLITNRFRERRPNHIEYEQIIQELGVSPSSEKGEAIMGLLTSPYEPASLDTPVKETEPNQRTLYDLLEGGRQDHSGLYTSELSNYLGEAIATLDERKQEIIRRRFGMTKDGRDPTVEITTLAEIGRDFGISREGVRQLQKSALKVLHKKVQHILAPDITEHLQ